MTTFETKTIGNTIALKVIGRIDGATSSEFDSQISALCSEKHRRIIIDFTEVTYLSSAGLRVFISNQKKLKAIDGELMLYNMNETVEEVFKLSGLNSIFKTIQDLTEFGAESDANHSAQQISEENFADIAYHCIKINNPDSQKSKLKLFGDVSKLATAEYAKSDVLNIPASELKFSCGLAAIGDEYQDYKQFFGEALSIENNFFTYPATKNPNPDYMNNIDKTSNFMGNFLYGFAFDGDYSKVVRVKSESQSYSLAELIGLAKHVSDSNVFGIAIIAESAGVLGINIKKVPLLELADGKPIDIYSNELFYDWFDFPIEHSDYEAVMLAVGVVAKSMDELPNDLRRAFSGKSDNHIHSIIFENGLVSRNMEDFSKEISRITTELEPQKIQHLLDDTRLKNIMFGIIELEN